jgi:hypothetical protein
MQLSVDKLIRMQKQTRYLCFLNGIKSQGASILLYAPVG